MYFGTSFRICSFFCTWRAKKTFSCGPARLLYVSIFPGAPHKSGFFSQKPWCNTVGVQSQKVHTFCTLNKKFLFQSSKIMLNLTNSSMLVKLYYNIIESSSSLALFLQSSFQTKTAQMDLVSPKE